MCNGVISVFVAASTRCFFDLPFDQACSQITDLEYDKLEIWLEASGKHLSPEDVGRDPEGFVNRFREMTRITPVAFCCDSEVDENLLEGICKAAKLLRITQVTLRSAPLGTPFNTEIDRLRSCVKLGSGEGVRISLKTESGRLTEDPHTAIELCQAVSGLGLTFDPSYYLGSPLGERSFDMVYPHTFHVHLRDSTENDLQVQVGLGSIDYSKLISQLARHNYNRALSVDLIPERIDIETRPLEMRKMRMLLDSLL